MENVDALMEKATAGWINDATRNRFKKGTAEISKIFSWFSEDWGTEEQIITWIKKYANEPTKSLLDTKMDVDYLDYDWGLNEKPKKKAS